MLLLVAAVSLLVGAGATSFAEYKLKYNLVDLILEKIGLAKKEVAAVEDVAKAVVADVKKV